MVPEAANSQSASSTSPTRSPGSAASASTSIATRTGSARALARHPDRSADARAARPAAGVAAGAPATKGLVARHRADRLGQVDDARRDGRPASTRRAATTSSRSRTRSSSCTTIKKCVVTQREVGTARADASPTRCARALREDPDVILVGEMRDLETIALALTAAETGILVFGTLHTTTRRADDRPHRRTCSRPTSRTQIRAMLAESLRMIVSQRLVRAADGKGRVAAAEILVNTLRRGRDDPRGQQPQARVGDPGRRQRSACRASSRSLRDLLRRQVIDAEEAALTASIAAARREHALRDAA